MRCYSQALPAVLIAGLAVGLSMAAVGATVATTGQPGSDLSIIVNRARKGDLLLPIPASNVRGEREDKPLLINLPRAPALDSKLPLGCESVVSSIVQSQLAHVVGRCLS
jgi:hypothetical protein